MLSLDRLGARLLPIDIHHCLPIAYRSTNQQDFEALGIMRYIALLVPCCRFFFSYLVDLYGASITAIASTLFRSAGSTFAAVPAKAHVKHLLQIILHVRSHFHQLILVKVAIKSIFIQKSCFFFRRIEPGKPRPEVHNNTKDSSLVDYADALCCKTTRWLIFPVSQGVSLAKITDYR